MKDEMVLRVKGEQCDPGYISAYSAENVEEPPTSMTGNSMTKTDQFR